MSSVLEAGKGVHPSREGSNYPRIDGPGGSNRPRIYPRMVGPGVHFLGGVRPSCDTGSISARIGFPVTLEP